MDDAQSPDRDAWAIPPEALAEWLTLAALVDEIGAVPCRTSDPEAWWPTRPDSYEARAALEACAFCPARRPCLDYAVAADEPEGIWGGLTPQEREKLPKGVRTVDPLRHGEHRTYLAGCTCGECRRANARRVADWRAGRRYAETSKAS